MSPRPSRITTDPKHPRFFPWYPAEGQTSIQRHWIDFAPITNPSAPWLVCNNPGSYAEEVATVRAGEEIASYWRAWPHVVGPVLVWMAYCGPESTSCSSFNGTGGDYWFKIAQWGLLSGTIRDGVWGQTEMVNNNYTLSVTIPPMLKGGAYLLRHELIALHVPYTPEFYPECGHLFVDSEGDELPGEEFLVSIPGVWTQDGQSMFLSCKSSKLTSAGAEPELHLSIYEEPTSSRTTWTIPGPDVWPPA